jgi:preprotein translocase subunit SecE
VLKSRTQASSSNGRAPDSKSGCWGFESLLACHFNADQKEAHRMFKKIMDFFTDVKLELKKVVFPTKKEVIGSTWVVIVTVLIAAFFLGLVDTGLGRLMTLAFK